MAIARGRNPMIWGGLSVLFSPLVTLPLLAVLGNASGYEPSKTEARPLKKIRPLTPNNGNVMAQMEKLATLKDSGALTEEEFVTAKSKILAKM